MALFADCISLPCFMKTTILSVIASVIIILVSFIFAWDEEFCPDMPLNDEKFGNYATVVGAIVTTFALIFLGMQLREMEQARNASYKPLLIPEDLHIYTKDSSKVDDVSPIHPEFYLDEDMQRSSKIYVNIHNMGKGVAKNIKIQWRYDIGDLKKYIEPQYILGPYWGRRFGPVNSISFIEETKYNPIPFPIDYLLCCGVRLNKPALFLSNKPKLTLILRCEDLHESVHLTKEFEVLPIVDYEKISMAFLEVKPQKN